MGRGLLGVALAWGTVLSASPSQAKAVLSTPPKFFSNGERSEVVFLCNQLPTGAVARLRAKREAELTILGASLGRSSSGGLFRNPLKGQAGSPEIKSVRVFTASSGNVVAAVRLATGASRVEALTLDHPPRVALRLFAANESKEEDQRERAPVKPQIARPLPRVRDVSPEKEIRRGRSGSRSTTGANSGTIVMVADASAPVLSPPAGNSGSKSNGPREAKREAGKPTQAKAKVKKRKTPTGRQRVGEPAAAAAGRASAAAPAAVNEANERGVEAGSSAATSRQADILPNEAPRQVGVTEEVDSFPYEIERIYGVVFLWPDLESPSYKADEEARPLADILRAAREGGGKAVPEGELAEATTAAALYLTADLSFVKAAKSKHFIDTIARYRRALRSRPAWPDARRALVNVLSAYAAMGFDSEALGVVHELTRGKGTDGLSSLARVFAARLAIDKGQDSKAREILGRMGSDREKAEPCCKALVEGELAATRKDQSRATEIMARLAQRCPAKLRDDPATRLLVARLHLASGDPAGALPILASLAGKLPSRRELRKLAWALVEAKEKTGDSEGAKEELEKIAAGGLGQTAAERARIELAGYSARDGNVDEALAVLAGVYVRAGGSISDEAARQAAVILGKPNEPAAAARQLIELASRGVGSAKVAVAAGRGAEKSTYELGTAFEAKDYARAIAAYARRPTSSGKYALDASHQWMVGKSYLELGFHEQAARLLRDVLPGAKGRLRVKVLSDLLRAVLAEKRYDEADRLAVELLRQPLGAPERSWAKLTRARALRGLGRRATALRLLREALKTAPPKLAAEIRLELARLIRTSDPRRARALARKAATSLAARPLGKDFIFKARMLEARSARRLGDFNGAAEALAAAAQEVTDPELAARLRYRQARLLERNGQAGAARAVYGKLASSSSRVLGQLSRSGEAYWKLVEKVEKLEAQEESGL